MINVAYCTDDNYASHCAVSITSLLENNKDSQCHVYVLTEGLNAESTKRFELLAKDYGQTIQVVVMDMAEINKLQVTNWLGSAMYFRFKIPEIVKESRVLYLDCDIIIRHSLKPLFDISLDDIACGVVEDQNGDDVRLHNPIGMFSRYFNSGVLLMNLDYWRDHDTANQLIKYIQDYPGQLMCPDQDTLNAVLEGKVLFLDYTYNFQQGFFSDELTWLQSNKWEAVREARKDPVIVHYSAGEKPWHKDCKNPMRGEYDKYMLLFPYLKENKTNGHRWYFYLVEGLLSELKEIYHWYRRKNGMIVNKA